MTKNTKKILSAILFLIFLFVVLPAYFFFDFNFPFNKNKTSPDKSIETKTLSARDVWVTEEYVNFDIMGATQAKEFLISTSDKRASEVGAKILEKGGNAIDAIIAAQMVLNVVEPQSSGIGGGAFLLYFDAKTKKTHYFNGRETAPMNANSKMFLDENGKPRDFYDVVKGGLSVGTPSLLKMLKLVHEQYGKLPWEELFQDAIQIAKDGFPMDRKVYQLAQDLSYLKEFDEFAKIYLKEGGAPKDLGQLIKNDDLVETLTIISKKGIEPFYEGEIAHNIVNKVQNSKINPGYLSLEDLKNYQVKQDDLICGLYRKFKVCSAPLPSSGGITLLQILGILENFDLKSYKPSSFEAIHLITEATKLAYVDRNRYIGDIDGVPVDKMLDKKYLEERSQLIKEDEVLKNVEPGNFAGWDIYATNENVAETPSTTHLSVVDKEGNVIAMTSSIEYIFGSVLVVDGFLLNNQLTDFSFIPTINDKKVANGLEPNKQPRSSMTPTFVFDENNNLILVLGSPGGPRIIQYVLKTIIACLDWNLSLEQSVALPNFVIIDGIIELEKGTKLEAIKMDLTELGQEVRITNITSGINAINIDVKNHLLIGSADFRRNGAAVGK